MIIKNGENLCNQCRLMKRNDCNGTREGSDCDDYRHVPLLSNYKESYSNYTERDSVDFKKSRFIKNNKEIAKDSLYEEVRKLVLSANSLYDINYGYVHVIGAKENSFLVESKEGKISYDFSVLSVRVFFYKFDYYFRGQNYYRNLRRYIEYIKDTYPNLKRKAFGSILEEIPRGNVYISSYDIKSIKGEIQKRGIRYLAHFTHINTLPLILKNGFLPHSLLIDKYTNAINDRSRADELTNCNCFTITRPNNYLRKKYADEQWEDKWVILLVDINIIFKYPTYFSETNAARKKPEIRRNQKEWRDYTNAQAFRSMFNESVEGKHEVYHREYNGIVFYENETTDEQAEVLVEGIIPASCIKRIVFQNHFYKDYFLGKMPELKEDPRISCDENLFYNRRDLIEEGKY